MVSGGVSNVSFSFRGNDPVREAIHTVFLYHAIQAAASMGIVNAGMLGIYDDLDPELRANQEDVVLNRKPGLASGRRVRRRPSKARPPPVGPGRMARLAGRGAPVACLVKGITISWSPTPRNAALRSPPPEPPLP